VCPGISRPDLSTLLLVTVLYTQGHNVSHPQHKILFPFVNSYLDQNFSGILQNKDDITTRCIQRTARLQCSVLSILVIICQHILVVMVKVFELSVNEL
jgi:hypothetical protein